MKINKRFSLLDMEDHYMVLYGPNLTNWGKINKKLKNSDTANNEGPVEYEEASYFIVEGSEEF